MNNKDLKEKTTANEAAAYQSSVENGAHADRLTRFNSPKGGHGFAAEQANDLIDKLHFKDSTIVGDDNKKNGPDRISEGTLIQTKYYQNAYQSVDHAFKNGSYRYVDNNGNFMQIEVPKDQYEAAIKYMEKRISDGQVPGISDPKDAVKLVRRGNIDYKTAVRIAKAGNIDSIMFDAAHGVVIASSAMGISGAITFARSIWDGHSTEYAIEAAAYEGLRSGGLAFVGSVVTAQVVRTGVNGLLLNPSIQIVKFLPSNIRHLLVNSLRSGAPIYGAAATNNLAKLMRGNIISAGVMIAILSAEDVSNVLRGRISTKQLLKDVTTLVSGVSGGYIGSAIGSTMGPVGAVIGGIIGSTLSGEAAHRILDKIVEDDVVEMLDIINIQLIKSAQYNILTQEELKISVNELRLILSRGELLNMFASTDREEFATKICEASIKKVIRSRAKIILPSGEEFLNGIGQVIELAEKDELKAYFESEKLDAKTVGRQLLDRDAPEQAADKALYVTKQTNIGLLNNESVLQRMKKDETSASNEIKHLEETLNCQRQEFNDYVNSLGGQNG
ncbi:hypothetical protein BXO88_13190 [Oribacterium sp. C9]|uniref:hypothetical protein n=1 Tax=Oribacterium sp. C9 TaxID=1943579 RepID=UPI00098EBC5A|nr:hypothetical protein [Oribacterium sp. C9]OON85218.1 hypothetical protein BXO88_13190 [Oribacterium sp. C9]